MLLPIDKGLVALFESGEIHLVEQHKQRYLGFFQAFEQPGLYGRGIGEVNNQQQQVGIDQGRAHGLHHALLQAVLRVEGAGGIGIDNLVVGAIEYAHHAVAGGLCFWRDDAELFAEQGVHERGLTRVGVADNIHKTSLMRSFQGVFTLIV